MQRVPETVKTHPSLGLVISVSTGSVSALRTWIQGTSNMSYQKWAQLELPGNSFWIPLGVGNRNSFPELLSETSSDPRLLISICTLQIGFLVYMLLTYIY
jgi:hypothetical protein